MRSKSRSRVASRSESPVGERPSWGFGPSRAASRLEDEYLDGYRGENRKGHHSEDHCKC